MQWLYSLSVCSPSMCVCNEKSRYGYISSIHVFTTCCVCMLTIHMHGQYSRFYGGNYFQMCSICQTPHYCTDTRMYIEPEMKWGSMNTPGDCTVQ